MVTIVQKQSLLTVDLSSCCLAVSRSIKEHPQVKDSLSALFFIAFVRQIYFRELDFVASLRWEAAWTCLKLAK